MIRRFIMSLFLVLACSFVGVPQAQEFYPIHFKELFTDEGAEAGQVVRLNSWYLSRKGFDYVNDTLHINPQTQERIELSIKQIEEMNEIAVCYFSTSNLDQVRKRLQEESSYLKQITPDCYQGIFGKVSNAFIIGEDTLIRNVLLHPVQFVLKYPKDARFNFSTEDFTFPMNGVYPLHNTSWYVKVSFDEATSYSSQEKVKLVLTQEEQPYKIDFIDDVRFKVSYVGKNKKTQTIGGTYSYGYTSIGFTCEAEKEKIERYVNGKPLYEEIPLAPQYYSLEQLEKIKDTPAYFQFVFSRNYDLTYYGGDHVFNLYGAIYHDDVKEGPPARVVESN